MITIDPKEMHGRMEILLRSCPKPYKELYLVLYIEEDENRQTEMHTSIHVRSLTKIVYAGDHLSQAIKAYNQII